MSKTFDELLESVNPGDTITGFLKANLKTILHQELQKARHDWLREEIVKLEVMKITNYPSSLKDPSGFCQNMGYNKALQTIQSRYQSELEQPISQDNK